MLIVLELTLNRDLPTRPSVSNIKSHSSSVFTGICNCWAPFFVPMSPAQSHSNVDSILTIPEKSMAYDIEFRVSMTSGVIVNLYLLKIKLPTCGSSRINFTIITLIVNYINIFEKFYENM